MKSILFGTNIHLKKFSDLIIKHGDIEIKYLGMNQDNNLPDFWGSQQNKWETKVFIQETKLLKFLSS